MSRGDYLGLAWRNESALAIFCQRDNASVTICARECMRQRTPSGFCPPLCDGLSILFAFALNSFPRVGDAIASGSQSEIR